MNSNYDNGLEAQIDRELKSLPLLTAPPMLTARVMTVITVRATAPWYRRPWPTWPVVWQAASLILLLAMFGGLCFTVWEFSHAVSVTATAQKLGGALSILAMIWNTLGVLANAAEQAVGHLGTGFILTILAAVLLAYAACIVLGSACYRLAYARR